MTARVATLVRVAEIEAHPDAPPAFDLAVLAHDERHLRRKTIELAKGGKVLVDFPEPVVLDDGDVLVLEDGRRVAIAAADEELLEIRAQGTTHLIELAWHIGNRHLQAQIEFGRILILRDHVIRAMLEGLGARVRDTLEPFSPARGAYSGHAGHGDGAAHAAHDHGHHHGHGDHDHGHGRHAHDHHDHHHDHAAPKR